MSKKKPEPTVRSGAAEYLTFVAATRQNGVNVVYADENVWLSQKMMAALYDVETPTVNYHLIRAEPATQGVRIQNSESRIECVETVNRVAILHADS